MEESFWETVFSGELYVMLDNNKKTKIFIVREATLCVFAMEAIRILENKLLTGADVVKNWRIKSFSPDEGILEIKKIKA